VVLDKHLHNQAAVNMVKTLAHDEILLKPLAEADNLCDSTFAGALRADENINPGKIDVEVLQRAYVFYNQSRHGEIILILCKYNCWRFKKQASVRKISKKKHYLCAVMPSARINTNNKLHNMEQRFCQSCGMPLSNELLGSNADGSKNEDYCIYCYKDGKFTQNFDMEQMIEHCAQFTAQINEAAGTNITPEQAKEQMRQFFPHLKRWKK